METREGLFREIDVLKLKAKAILGEIQGEPAESVEQYLAVFDVEMQVADLYLCVSHQRMESVGRKDSSALDNARKSISSALGRLETIYGSYILDTQEKAALHIHIEIVRLLSMGNQCHQLILEVAEAEGISSKYYFAFTDTYSRFAKLLYNMSDVRQLVGMTRKIGDPNYAVSMEYVTLLTEVLMTAAKRYRLRYEYSDVKHKEDINNSINFLDLLDKLYLYLEDSKHRQSIEGLIEATKQLRKY